MTEQRFILLVDSELKEQMARLHAAHAKDPGSLAGREYLAAMEAMTALRHGREADFEGKQLGYGPQSYDLRDCAELKVPVLRQVRRDGTERGPSHRLTYQEFEPLPRITVGDDGRLERDPDALPFRHLIAFEARGAHPDPATVTGERLGRRRGLAIRRLAGLGGGRPEGGRGGRAGGQRRRGSRCRPT